MFNYELLNQDGQARAGEITTSAGSFATPAFMPVGTAASVKGILPAQLEEMQTPCVLANCYHLMLRPSAERIAEQGGLHAFMQWQGNILTDSGGFQAMSLAKLREITDTGIRFQSHIDGSSHMLTPQRSMEVQTLLGSNIQMVLDECLKLPASKSEMQRAMQLSLRWAEISKQAFLQATKKHSSEKKPALFGIVQGGDDKDLRSISAKELCAIGFDGYALGGLAVGEPQEVMLRVLDESLPLLPENSPRYVMGIGTPDDLVEAVARGADMFDCVLPSRAGRHGLAYGWFGKRNLRNQKFRDDKNPLNASSTCAASRDFSCAYYHHLFAAKELLAMSLLTWHNLNFYQELMATMRTAILENSFADFLADWRKNKTNAEES